MVSSFLVFILRSGNFCFIQSSHRLLLCPMQFQFSYNFCDGKFVGCEIFPGRLIPPDECDGPVITGCNEALLESDSGIVARLGRSTRFVSIIGSIVLALML